MSDTRAHNAAVCERYLRFVIEIEYTGNHYYTVWGTDHNSPEEEDKMLVDSEGHFLLFKTVDAAIAYVREQQEHLFDKQRFASWLGELQQPITPHMGIDLDLLHDEEINISTEESFEELINVQNFVSDYAHQLGDEYLMDLFYEHPLETLFDLYIDTYLEESTQAPPAPKGLEEDAIPKLNELYDIISKKIKIM